MLGRVLDGDTPARKAWIGAIIDRIEVDRHAVRIFGRKDVLEHAVGIGGELTPGVGACVPKWRSYWSRTGFSRLKISQRSLTSANALRSPRFSAVGLLAPLIAFADDVYPPI
jgi:hypothetical protein